MVPGDRYRTRLVYFRSLLHHMYLTIVVAFTRVLELHACRGVAVPQNEGFYCLWCVFRC